jgi:hypothetical protein
MSKFSMSDDFTTWNGASRYPDTDYMNDTFYREALLDLSEALILILNYCYTVLDPSCSMFYILCMYAIIRIASIRPIQMCNEECAPPRNGVYTLKRSTCSSCLVR